MTYREFIDKNTNLRHLIRDTEDEHNVSQEKRKKFLRIMQVDFNNNTCQLSSGEILPINKVVEVVTSGIDCISNPSALFDWKGFSNEVSVRKDNKEEKGSVKKMSMEDENFSLPLYLREHKGEKILLYGIMSDKIVPLRGKILNADKMGVLLEFTDKDNNTVSEYIFYHAVRSIKLVTKTPSASKVSLVESLLD